MMDNSGDKDGTARELEYDFRPARRRRGDDGDDVVSLLDAYLVAEWFRAWEAAHPEWSLNRRGDFGEPGYWEAFRVRGAERTVVCRHSQEDLEVRVEEILAAEARTEAATAAVRGPGPGP
jgi:hypothetical protein